MFTQQEKRDWREFFRAQAFHMNFPNGSRNKYLGWDAETLTEKQRNQFMDIMQTELKLDIDEEQIEMADNFLDLCHLLIVELEYQELERLGPE